MSFFFTDHSNGTSTRVSINLYATCDGDASTHRYIWFEYGTTESYGSETAHALSYLESYWTTYQTVWGLQSDTVYHYRAVARLYIDGGEGGDPIYSADHTVSTSTAEGTFLSMVGGGDRDVGSLHEPIVFIDNAGTTISTAGSTNALSYINTLDASRYGLNWVNSSAHDRRFFNVESSVASCESVKLHLGVIRSNQHTLRYGFRKGASTWESSSITSGAIGVSWIHHETYTLVTNPLTGLPWAAGDFDGLELSIYLSDYYSSGGIYVAFAELELVNVVNPIICTGAYTIAYSGATWAKAKSGPYFNIITSAGLPRYIWIEANNIHFINEEGIEQVVLTSAGVADVPVDGDTSVPISSNWAFDHVAAADPHAGYVLESLFDADTFLYAPNDNTPVATSPANVLAALTGHAAAAFDWNNQNLDNVKQINLTDPTELTIAAGVITKTQGFHTVDTEADAALDSLDTINGGAIGDVLVLSLANNAREVQVTRAGNIRFQPEHMIEGASFSSPAGSSGIFYAQGFYNAPAADANLTNAAPTVSFGTANSAHASRMFLVAAAAGTTNAGTVSIVVSGTSINSAGTRSAADSEVLVADVTTMSTDAYYQTTKRWIGTVVYTLTGAGGAAAFAADFNYGKALYDDFDDRNFTIKLFECFGRAGANDSGFDVQLLHHKATGWTYSAAAFAPGTAALCSLATEYSTEKNLVLNERFSYERELSQSVSGTAGEGYLIRIITGANKAVDFLSANVYAEAPPNDHHLKTTGQAMQLVYNGTYWMKI